MNVGVPGEGDQGAFYAVVGAMVVIVIGMISFFRRRGWL
jgi:Mg2+ and Co2+ transporter CorA